MLYCECECTRYHAVLFTLYKAAIVSTALFTPSASRGGARAALSLQFGLHFCFLLYNLAARPFIDDVDDYMASGLTLALVVIASAGLGYG